MAVAQRLASEPIGAVLSSDLRRAVETAGPIAAAHRIGVTAAPLLRERHLGAFQGLTFDEITRDFAGDWEEVFRSDGRPPGGGETRSEVTGRVSVLLAELLAEPPAPAVVLVGHGGSLRALYAALLGMPDAAAWRFRVDNASLSIFDIYPEGAIAYILNDTCHLEGQCSPER